ncbi:MAG: DUF2147 domain-containing protein [Saprospiraceae bacterium]|nr:DUF2147 domain-containing protein [Saprospiraceae bacterium]
MKKWQLLFALLLGAFTLTAQSITGVWKTIDDENGQAKSHVQLYEQGGKMYGKVVKILTNRPDRICEKCPGDRHNQPVMNMVILENMVPKDGFYQSGRILDPEKGKWYNCKMWLKDGDPNVLVVRGFVGPFYRTQYWYRVQ